jgi:glyoxylase-like metal-dependent hydrolase (beta-lactamase superfamily II)
MQIYPGIILMGGVGYDSNVYLIDGELIIDTGTGIFFPEIKEELELSYDINNIRNIVNTHCHFDHTGGNKKFRDWLKTDIAIHEKDKKSLETGAYTMAEAFDQKARTVTVDRVLKNNDKVKTTNFNFEVIWTPGHTPGSICLYEKKKKILISGDTVFEDGVGSTDFPGSSQDELFKSLRKLSNLTINYLLPGHGMPKIGGVNFMIRQHLMVVKEKEIQ